MDETTFWQMIEQAKADSGGDGEEQMRLVTLSVSQLEISQIVEFHQLYKKYEVGLNREDVLDAAYFATKGYRVSEFRDFCAWLIAQGKDAYHFVLQDLDNLSELVPVQESESVGKYGEVSGDLWLIAPGVYKKLTRKYDLFGGNVVPPKMIKNGASLHVEPSDKREYEQYLKEHYPRIAAKFWDDEDYS